MRPAPALLLAALAAAACDHLRTDSGEFGVSFADFVRLPGPSPFLVLGGTRLCDDEPRCGPCDQDPPVCEGVDLAVAGADRDPAGCHTVEVGAPLIYTFTPRGCSAPTPAESLTVDAIAFSAVDLRLDPPLTLAGDLPRLGFPASVQGAPLPAPARYSPLQLLAGAPARLRIELREPTSARFVGWNPGSGALAIDALAGPAPAVEGALPGVTLTVAADARASAALTVQGVTRPLPEIHAVGPEAIDHLESSALLFSDPAGQFPVQVEAHALDAAGQHIAGVPIQWRVLAGDLVLDLGDDDPTAPAAALLECIPREPRATRSGVVEAVHGAHRATLELRWDAYRGDEDAPNAGPCAEDGCGCRGGAPGGWTGLGLGLLALGRRRRVALART